MSVDKALEGAGGFLDDRFRGAKSVRNLLKKIFPDHWTFLLGEIALYSFIILLLTGTFLTLFFKPSMTDVIYHGSYTKLNGVHMSDAYASTLNISFDVRGGLLMRQIHHWAAILFLAAIMAHMLRIFFTGAFRKPREINWLIGVTLLALGIVEGFAGYSLPDDLLSGTGLRILEGVLLSIPIVGTYISFFVFGGQFPGNDLIPRLYIVHVLLLPAIILALVSAHLFFMFHQKHTQMPGKGRTDQNVVGAPMYPYFMAKTGAFFFFVFAVCAGLSTFAQINPIWLFGPYNPAAISAGSQPDFYMGWLEGALRMMPAWQINFLGHSLALGVFIAGLLVLGVLITGLAMYPFLEQWVTGDKREHHVLDRPRDAPTRTAIGAGGVTFYGLLWLIGGNDLIARFFDIQLYWTTWFGRVMVIVGPVIAYIVTKRICLGLQRKDRALLEHGVESGIVMMKPTGEFVEVTRPLPEEARAVLTSRKEPLRLPAGHAADENGVPSPATRGVMGKLRVRLNHVFAEEIPLPDGHGNGHGNGHPELPAGAEEKPALPEGSGQSGPTGRT
ncbi:MAG TPA: ubiquinol-cytochrome c reductase cytochrome b subunit [Streptosporangiaceae bacterium]|nr:ubiquinol-cytochrome c reductase cytochrome b subunit [Streptosporangiaceae bacterium]